MWTYRIPRMKVAAANPEISPTTPPPNATTHVRRSLAQTRVAATWRQYENLDNLLHRQIAQASRNTVLLGLFDALNAIRRIVVWGRLRPGPARPPADHHSFAEHERIVDGIENRDLARAASAMRLHLQSVESHLIPLREAAE